MHPLPPASYDEALARRALAAQPQLAGGSGYFAPRAQGLDPALFRNERLLPDVRLHVLHTLFYYWATHYSSPQVWATVWLAGSGITTAWNADREAGGAPGDLDTLIGIDYNKFFAYNPRYVGNSEGALAQHFNQQLHDELWPSTARTVLNGSVYELTYYVNPGGSDIRDINPYAAYDVTHDSWTVHPVDVPVGFSDAYFSDADRALVASDHERASAIVEHFNQLKHQISIETDQARVLNKATALHNVVRAGAALFDEIHDGRHAAFAPGGKGYFDAANYRWQAGKGSGAVPAARVLKQLDEQVHRDLAQPCESTAHLLLLAGLVNGGSR